MVIGGAVIGPKNTINSSFLIEKEKKSWKKG